jgi:hypothetical protein
MEIENFVGTWKLSAYSRDESVAELGDDGPDYEAIANWVNDCSPKTIKEMKDVTGLVLTITKEGLFSELLNGNPDVEWFDKNGILCANVQTFDGVVDSSKSKTSLIADGVSSWDLPDDDLYEAKCRYDDGDTLICDYIQKVDGYIVRTVNVVSDEEHLYRNTFIYSRS